MMKELKNNIARFHGKKLKISEI